jgi:phosphoglycolate phosphatase
MERALVIFDFDGTIADSFGESLLAYNRVAPRLRLRPVAESEVPELRRMTVGQLMTALAVPMWKLPRLMIAVRADLMEHFHGVKPVRGIPRALRQLRAIGHRLAIVTSNSKPNVRAFLARHDLDVFPTIVAGSSIFGKATRLRRLLRAAHLDGSRSVFIGDTTPDIRAAHDAGTLAVAVTWGFAARGPLEAENPAAVVDRPAELLPALARLLRNG